MSVFARPTNKAEKKGEKVNRFSNHGELVARTTKRNKKLDNFLMGKMGGGRKLGEKLRPKRKQQQQQERKKVKRKRDRMIEIPSTKEERKEMKPICFLIMRNRREKCFLNSLHRQKKGKGSFQSRKKNEPFNIHTIKWHFRPPHQL